LQLIVSNRKINIYLFGGEHGDYTHYEAMSSFVVKKGLSLPPQQRKTEIDASKPKISSLTIPEVIEHEEIKRSLEPLESRLKQATESFDRWMKNYFHNSNNTLSEKLVDWFGCNLGAELIYNFNEFLALASKLDENEQYNFSISTMPTNEQYAKAMELYNQRIKLITKIQNSARDTKKSK